MAVTGLLDSLVAVFRQDQSQTDSLGDVDTATFVGQYRASLQMPRLGARDEGAGDRPSGIFTLFIEKKADVVLNDILELRSGPNRGKWLIIATEPFVAGRGSHIEVNVKTYVGVRPDA